MKKYLKYLSLILILFILNINFCYAEDYIGTVDGTGVNIRSGPGTNYASLKTATNKLSYKLVSNTLYKSESACSNGWYQLYYEGDKTGYICSDYLIVSVASTNDGVVTKDKYDRPWTTPKEAIVGGAKFITETYIDAGQNTSYLKKFNVNPNSDYKVYNHQYMANLRAPYSEAYTSYKSYRDNNLLALPLEFTIPIFLNMPDYTTLPGTSTDTSCQSTVTDQEFEAELNAEGFPESYKCKLRLIHEKYPNWTFKALHTNLDFDKSVIAEKSVSSIQGGDIYYDLSSGDKIQTESGWYVANYETVAYYLDPRNFLKEERILMFENLGYSENYSTTVVQSILKGTFMEEYSLIDNQSYAEIFVEAGKVANISAVYLASLARQESGTGGSRATSGVEFTYQGVTYQGLYNFYNIGASSSAESPILAGLVWASGGSSSVIVGSNDSNQDSNTDANPSTSILTDNYITSTLGVNIKNGCLIGLNAGTTLNIIQNKLSGLEITISNYESFIKTNQVITISDGTVTLTYTLVVLGDVDGDGLIGATDYVKIKNYIMEKSGSELNLAQSLAADVDNNGSIGATDYVKIKNSIMEG